MAAPRCRQCGGRSWTDKGRCRECNEYPTLGWLVDAWIQQFCVIPDRDEAGQQFVPTEEQADIILRHWRVNPHAQRDARTGRWMRSFVYERGTQVMKPQKWGKAPISSAFVCVEAAPDGPVLFDGWDADGQPVGRPWATPHVQVTACSEDQTDNVWRALLPMIQLGPLADVFVDSGLTRINLPTGGLIEPVTAAAVSRLGQRVSFVVQDQTESWVQSNGGHNLADNQRRGLAGTGGRFLETPNAYDPVEQSVAQQTHESKAPGVYKTYENPPAGSVRNRRERDKVLREVYGDSTIEQGGWIDIERIHTEIEALLEYDPAQAERWFLNRCQASEGAAFDFEAFKGLVKPRTLEKHSVVVLGVDGARHDDALAVIATDVKSGYQWVVDIVERPADADDEYKHDQARVDAAVSEVFDRFVVWRAYCDTQHIGDLVTSWQNRWGEKRVLEWLTYRPRPIAFAVRGYEQAISQGLLTHDGDERFVRHVRNARRRKLTVLDDRERQMHTLCKDHVKSPRKIDAAMAAVLSWEARSDCIAAGGVMMDEVPVVEVPEPVKWDPRRMPALAGWTPRGESGPLGPLS